MISNINDVNLFNKLGFQVNDNFDKLFILDDINGDDNNYLFGYYDNGLLVGFIHVIKLVDELEIINIVVDKDYRVKGYGSKLLNYIIDYFDNVRTIFLEVNVNNKAAINLYKKFEFEVVNVRKKYYGNDDCYVMRKER